MTDWENTLLLSPRWNYQHPCLLVLNKAPIRGGARLWEMITKILDVNVSQPMKGMVHVVHQFQ